MAPKTGKTKASAKAPCRSSRPAPPAVLAAPATQRAVLTVAEAETQVLSLQEADWASVRVESPHPVVAKIFSAILTLLGAHDPADWKVAQQALEDPPSLLRKLFAVGPWGAPVNNMQDAETVLGDTLSSFDLPGGSPTARPRTPGNVSRTRSLLVKPAGVSKPVAKASSSCSIPRPPGSVVAFPLGQLVEAYTTTRKSQKPPPFPMLWPVTQFAQLHERLQQALWSQQHACVVCTTEAAYTAATLYFKSLGSNVSDVKTLQVLVHLAKSLGIEAARRELVLNLQDACTHGRQCVLLLGSAPQNLRHFCNSQFPIEAFDAEMVQSMAETLGVTVVDTFHLVVVAMLSSATAQEVLPQVVPNFDHMAVMILDASVPRFDTFVEEIPGLWTALRILALSVDPSSIAMSDDLEHTGLNDEPFEYLEDFDDSWEDRWIHGPNTNDERGKPLRGKISTQLIKYPSNPKDNKPCLQLMGGAVNAPCTGIATFFMPLVRPTEVEFEFTVNGKVDQPNACVVLTEKAFQGSLPDCKVGVQFFVRGGMHLSGGTDGIVKINNDGKVKNDKWNKVLLRLDWSDKVVVGQVDSVGKGYAPAVQSVPFRDPACQGIGFLYIYNSDMQAACCFHKLRIAQGAVPQLDKDALDARAHLVKRHREREYQRAVDADMAVGMKMGAISSTQSHGMNLAQEQAANHASSFAAKM